MIVQVDIVNDLSEGFVAYLASEVYDEWSGITGTQRRIGTLFLLEKLSEVR